MVPQPFSQHIQNQYGPAQLQLCCLEARSPSSPAGCPVCRAGEVMVARIPFTSKLLVQGFWLAGTCQWQPLCAIYSIPGSGSSGQVTGS